MASQYKTIQGIRYERDLLDVAEAAGANGRVLTKEHADILWKKAMDGNKVTPTEHRTLQYIVDNFKWNEAGKRALQLHLAKGKAVSSTPLSRTQSSESVGRKVGYYQTIKGVSYDRELLEKADRSAAANGGVLSMRNILDLWAAAHDGNKVTECEKRTLKYIAEKYAQQNKLESQARDMIEELLECKIQASLTDVPPTARSAEERPSFLTGLWQRITGRGAVRSLEDGATTSPPGKRPRLDDNSGPRAIHDAAASDLRTAASPVRNSPHTVSSAATNARTPAASSTSTAAARAAEQPSRQSLQWPTLTASEDELPAELRELLSEGNGPMLQLELPAEARVVAEASPAEDPALIAQRAKAQAEIERIFKAKTAADILGTSTKEDQKQEFARLARLLHPDKGFVDANDSRANVALRLVMAAWNRSRKES